MRDLLSKQLEETKQSKTVNNIEHFVVHYTSDKSKFIRFRNSIQVSD